jgi:hypothetical protein
VLYARSRKRAAEIILTRAAAAKSLAKLFLNEISARKEIPDAASESAVIP